MCLHTTYLPTPTPFFFKFFLKYFAHDSCKTSIFCFTLSVNENRLYRSAVSVCLLLLVVSVCCVVGSDGETRSYVSATRVRCMRAATAEHPCIIHIFCCVRSRSRSLNLHHIFLRYRAHSPGVRRSFLALTVHIPLVGVHKRSPAQRWCCLCLQFFAV